MRLKRCHASRHRHPSHCARVTRRQPSLRTRGVSATTGKPNSYIYAPDELDARMTNGGICNLAPTSHHAQQWQSGRRLRSAEDLQVPRMAPEPGRARHPYLAARDIRTYTSSS